MRRPRRYFAHRLDSVSPVTPWPCGSPDAGVAGIRGKRAEIPGLRCAPSGLRIFSRCPESGYGLGFPMGMPGDQILAWAARQGLRRLGFSPTRAIGAAACRAQARPTCSCDEPVLNVRSMRLLPRREFAPAGDLLSCLCKKVGKRIWQTRPPVTSALRATRPWQRLPGWTCELACGSNSKPGRPQADTALTGSAKGNPASVQAESSRQISQHSIPFVLILRQAQDRVRSAYRRMNGAPHRRSHGPMCPVRRRATQGTTEKGRGLSEARRAEFRSPRCGRVAQGTAQRRGTGLCFFASFLAQARKGVARRGESRRDSSSMLGLHQAATTMAGSAKGGAVWALSALNSVRPAPSASSGLGTLRVSKDKRAHHLVMESPQ
jgi:hypothetical protein